MERIKASRFGKDLLPHLKARNMTYQFVHIYSWYTTFLISTYFTDKRIVLSQARKSSLDATLFLRLQNVIRFLSWQHVIRQAAYKKQKWQAYFLYRRKPCTLYQMLQQYVIVFRSHKGLIRTPHQQFYKYSLRTNHRYQNMTKHFWYLHNNFSS